MVYWEAQDTSANTTASFGGLQISVAGGTIDTLQHYFWTDWSVSTTSAGASAGVANGNAAGGDISWAAFVTTGGASSTALRSNGRIYFEFYNENQLARIWWDALQINNGLIVRRMGAGYYFGGTAGPITKLHFFSNANNLAAGTKFELWAVVPR